MLVASGPCCQIGKQYEYFDPLQTVLQSQSIILPNVLFSAKPCGKLTYSIEQYTC